jgi:hypothetical protein
MIAARNGKLAVVVLLLGRLRITLVAFALLVTGRRHSRSAETFWADPALKFCG